MPSDIVWKALIDSTLAAGVTITLAWMGQHQANKAARKAEEVKSDLRESSKQRDIKLDNLATVANKTHTLVNSNMAVQLKKAAELSRWKANHEPTEENIKAAELAEQLYSEHQSKQAEVDLQSPVGSG
jgi:hypothetical protein